MTNPDPRQTLDTLAQELAKRRAAHQSGIQGSRWRRRALRTLVGLVALVFLGLAGVFFVNFFRLNSDLIEGHIKGSVLPGLTQGRFPLDVGRISGDLLHGIELEHLMVRNPAFPAGGVFVSIPRISLRYSLFDVFFGNLVLERVIIQDPVVNLSRGPDGRAIWDFPAASGTATASEPAVAPDLGVAPNQGGAPNPDALSGQPGAPGTVAGSGLTAGPGTAPASEPVGVAGTAAAPGRPAAIPNGSARAPAMGGNGPAPVDSPGSAGPEGAAGPATGSRRGGLARAQARAQVLADRYLAHVEIRNLSLLVPNPRDLLPDPTVARLLRLPPGNFYRTGLNLLLRKFPGRDFTTHLLKVTLPEDPSFLTFQVTRLNTTGDFTLSAQFLRQDFELAVQNLGAAGRRVLFYDGRDKSRLNLRWLLGRPGKPLPERITGMTGVLRLDSLAPLESWLPEGARLAGSVRIDLSATDTSPLRETVVACEAAGLRAELPGLPPLENLDLKLTSRGGLAAVERATFQVAGFVSSHTGTLDLRNPDHLSGEFSSVLAGDPLTLRTGWRKVEGGESRLWLVVGRPGGELNLEATRLLTHGVASYRDLTGRLEVAADRSVWDLVPTRLLAPSIRERFQAFFDKVTVVGPLRADVAIPSPADWPRGTADLRLDGARLQNRQNPAQGVVLGGQVRLSQGRLQLADTSATLAALTAMASGVVTFATDSRRVSAYDLEVTGSLAGGKVLSVTGDQVADSCGLARPPFDSLELEGGRVVEARVTWPGPAPVARVAADRVRLKKDGKPWWIDKLQAEVRPDAAPDPAGWRPRLWEATASCRLFEVDLQLAAAVEPASRTFRRFRADGKGDDLQAVVKGLAGIPAVGAALKKWGLSVAGGFTFGAGGQGPFARPAVEATLDVPRLRLSARDAVAEMPFTASFTSPAEGRYRGQVRTRKAALTVRGVAFPLDAAQAEISWDRSQGKAGQVLGVQAQVQSFGTTVAARGEYLPTQGQIRQAAGTIASTRIEELAREVARIGKFNLPFTLVGKAGGEWKLAGPVADPRGEGFLEVDSLGLTFPLRQRGNQVIALQVEDLAGRLGVKYGGRDGESAVSLAGVRGKVLGADLFCEGSGRLRRQGGGTVPEFDRVVASFTGLPADRTFALLAAGYFPPATTAQIKEVAGTLSGSLDLGGAQNRFHAVGEARLEGGRLHHQLLQAPLEQMKGRFLFSRRAGESFPVVEIRDFAAVLGRTRFGIPLGRFTDPQGAGGLELEGRIDQTFPTDIMKLLSGWSLPSVTFPKEGAMSGRVRVAGTLGRPRLALDLETMAMLVDYRTDQQNYTVPLGKCLVGLAYDPGTGEARVATCSLGLLGGRIEVSRAEAVLDKGRPRRFAVAGKLQGIDVGTLRTGGETALRGVMDGTFTAEQTATGSREALFQLAFRDIVVPQIPVDPEAVQKIGLEFLESPEFTVGRLNLYLSSDEEAGQQGRVRVADGLFAGPDMRLEIGNSAFDPLNLQLDAKIFFNPQPLRTTKLGRKLGSLTKHLQDSKTGLPFVDLTVSGHWDNPGLLGRTISKRAESRGKRNFIKSIFGGRRAHKASVEELMEWFPGWKPEKP
ncbi:MAG: hypothetical protein GX442_03875 [Candidatus Riflebacteria bacterium]|nr:hypothetical protein [Candidatus Riflebacteria bacterium]